MIEVRTLGIVTVTRDGNDVPLQPKRLLLLAYLLLEGREAPVRRDQLLALFWPESDAERGRNALRQALFALRTALGTEVIHPRGIGELVIDHASVRCDALALLDAAATADHATVNALYGGEFCPALHVSESPDVERWVDDTRVRCRRLVTMAVRAMLASADASLALRQQHLERLIMLSPYDESAAMQLFAVLVETGDRSGAVATYRAFAARLRADLAIEPSDAFAAMVDAARVGEGVAVPLSAPPVGRDRVGTPENSQTAPVPLSRRRWGRTAVLATIAILSLLAARLRAGVDERLVEVSGIEHVVTDTAASRLAVRTAEKLRGELVAVPGFQVRDDAGGGIRLRRAGTVVRGGIERAEHARWRAWASVTAAETDMLLQRTEVEGSSADSVLSVLADRVVAIVATRRNMELRWGETLHRPSGRQALEHYLSAFSAVESGDAEEGISRFESAWRADSVFYFAGILAAGNALAINEFARGDSLLRELARFESRMLPLERHQFRRALTLARSDVIGTLQESRAIAQLEPRAPFLVAQLAEDAYLANRPQEALTALERLDELKAQPTGESAFNSIRAAAYHTLGKFADELATIDATIAGQPTHPHFSALRVAPLAALGRADTLRVMLAALAARDDGRDVGRLYRSAALELQAHGHATPAVAMFREGLQWLERHPATPGQSVSRTIAAAELLNDAGDHLRSWTLVRRLRTEVARPLTLGERSALLGLEAALAVKMGRRTDAMMISDSLSRLAARGRNGIETFRRARISAALGDAAATIALFEQALQEGFITNREVHLTPEFAWLRANSAFQRVVAPRG